MFELVHFNFKSSPILCRVSSYCSEIEHQSHLQHLYHTVQCSKSSLKPFHMSYIPISSFSHQSHLQCLHCTVQLSKSSRKPFDLLELVHFSFQIISNECSLDFNILNLFTIWTDCHQGVQNHTTVVCNHFISKVDIKQWDI